MGLDQIMSQVRSYDCPLVEITGGEPLHQTGVIPLIADLCQERFKVLIETSGAIDISSVDSRAQIILDVKCPGSGMMNRMDWSNLNRLTRKDQVKFVIKDRDDYVWAVNVIRTYQLTDRCPVLFSPVFGQLELEPRDLAEWVLTDRLPVRVQLQLHKLIWDPEARGV